MNRKLPGLVGLILLVAVPLLSACAPASETASLQDQADQVASNKEVVHRFVEIFESGNWDDLDEVIAATVCFTIQVEWTSMAWRR